MSLQGRQYALVELCSGRSSLLLGERPVTSCKQACHGRHTSVGSGRTTVLKTPTGMTAPPQLAALEGATVLLVGADGSPPVDRKRARLMPSGVHLCRHEAMLRYRRALWLYAPPRGHRSLDRLQGSRITRTQHCCPAWFDDMRERRNDTRTGYECRR